MTSASISFHTLRPTPATYTAGSGLYGYPAPYLRPPGTLECPPSVQSKLGQFARVALPVACACRTRWSSVSVVLGLRQELSFAAMTTPRAKHTEYTRKLVEWARLFEQEYGASPTEDDRVASNTWNALNDKVAYYRRLLREQGVSSPAASPSSRRIGSRRESSSRESSHRESSSRENSREKSRCRTLARSHESSPDLRFSSSPGKSRRHSRRQAAEEAPLALPEINPAVAGYPEVASLEAKARESREKLLKWQRAYEREQGDPPRPEDRAASSTYTSYERKYVAYRAQLERQHGQRAPHWSPDISIAAPPLGAPGGSGRFLTPRR